MSLFVYITHHRHYPVFFILCVLFLSNCSNQTPPTGGPKDESPPVLLSSIPKNEATNYKESLIRLNFDEYIRLNSPSREILIVPSVGRDISYLVKGKSLIIKPKEQWVDSTTYSVSIRGAVQDITEGNQPKNLKLSFSTGDFIDSLFVIGRVNFVQLNLFPKEKKVTVALYQVDTFDIFKHTPFYFTETDEKGRFRIDNIRGGSYYIYAFGDDNSNMTVESKTESYGFLANSISVDNQSDSITIGLVNLDARLPKINTIRNRGLFTKITFNKPLAEYTLKYDYDSSLVHSFGDSFSEIRIYNPTEIKDSIQFTLTLKDELEKGMDTVFYIKQVDIGENFVPDDFEVKTDKIKITVDSSRISTTIKLSKPLKKINYDSVFIPLDSTNVIAFSEEDFTYDSLHKELSLSKNLFENVVKDSLFEKYKPTLSFANGFIISIENDSSEASQHTIPLIKKEETGTLLVEVNSEEKHYIIELLSENGEIIESVYSEPKYSFKNLPVKNYKLRVIIDSNNNKKWDAGNIYRREEPENIYFYENAEGEHTFPIRANWEVGPLVLIF